MILNFIGCHIENNRNPSKINIGDWASAPGRYLKFNDKCKICSLRDVTEKYLKQYDKKTHIIIGGGAIVGSNCMTKIIMILNYFVGIKVLWGADGSDFNLIIDKFDILGTRNIHVYNKYKNKCNIHYVPCASCMFKMFKRFNSSKCSVVPEGTILYGSIKKPNRNFAPKMRNKYEIVTNRGRNLFDKINQLKTHKTIITNSYHGYFWCLLLNKQPNIDAIQHPSLFDDETYIKDHNKRSKYVNNIIENNNDDTRFYLEYKTNGLIYTDPTKINALSDSRRRNIEFKQKVEKLIEDFKSN
jgi:hypothetical protein